MSIALFGRVIAYGFPALLLLLGFSAWTGGTIAELIFGTSEGMALIGLFLMFLGVAIYLAEIFVVR